MRTFGDLPRAAATLAQVYDHQNGGWAPDHRLRRPVMPRRQVQMILGWAELHNEELGANWQRLLHEETLRRIEGLAQGKGGMMATEFGVYYDVTEVEIAGDYTLRLTFDDETQQVIDFEPLLYGPVFEPLRDLALFNQVKLNRDTGAIEWPTGADFNPTINHDWPEYRERLIAERRQRYAVAHE